MLNICICHFRYLEKLYSFKLCEFLQPHLYVIFKCSFYYEYLFNTFQQWNELNKTIQIELYGTN